MLGLMVAGMSDHALQRRLAAEAVGTALLLIAIVGSGIAVSRLTDDVALALLVNAVATGLALAAIIAAIGPISGAHLNPAVSFSVALERGLAWRDVPWYVGAQVVGAAIGVVIANVMFALPAVELAGTQRSGTGLLVGEVVATFGLVAVIWGAVRLHAGATVAVAVGAYITAAIWFTSSTSFANPAVTVGRMLTDTFTGIAPADALPFILAQLVGAVLATRLFRWLIPSLPATADEVVVTRDPPAGAG